MATTFTDLIGNGSATKPFSFPSIKEADIKVEVDAVDYENRGITGASSGTTTFTITSYTTTGGGNVVFDSAPGSGALIRIYRDTDVDTPKATYTAGSSIKAGDLNNNQTQLLYAAQEEQNQTVITADIKNEAITTAKIKDQNVNTSKLANDAVTGAKIADDAINSEHYVDGSIDTVHIADNAVTTAKIPDDAITGPKLGTDSIDGHNIQDNSINSEHYVDGSIDTAHIADAQITTAKIADSNVTTAKIADSNITTAKIADDAVTDAKIADGTLDGRYYTETELDAGQLDNRYFTETELSNGSLDSRYFTETELTNGALDGRYFTETEADARYFNISASETIKDGDTFPDNDTTIATTAAINDRIIDLVDDVGGFVPIANETSFPNANPDVNNGTGTLVSIKALSQNLTSNGSGEISISNGTVGNSTVTITGAANSTTYAATFGMIVETTTTLNTYTFHRLVPKATEVSTVSGSISNVNTVGNAISNVNSVASNATNINTVAGINANVTTVAGISSDVTTVASNNSNVTAVAGNASNINSAVSNASNINSAVSNASNINSAVSNESNINSAVSNASNINTVAGSISNVNTAATNIASINTAASNITNVNNFADVYQVASSNPSTDGGGNAVAEGDLYFNTTANRLKVYDGANWVDGVSASSGGGVQTTGATFTGDVKLNDDVKLLVGTGNDLEIFHDTSNSYIKDVGSGSLILESNHFITKSAAYSFQNNNNTESLIYAVENGKVELFFDNSSKFETQSGGVGVTGDITVSGNVDGRDVAADGAKLDGIEASATADQTASEIVALVADQTIAPSEIDMEDNEKIKLGTGDDLEIYHDGTNSNIYNATGEFKIRGNDVRLMNAAGNEHMLIGTANGSVALYYDNSKKLETTASGVTVTGTLSATSHVYPTTDNTSDLGSSVLRYRNQYISGSGMIDFLDNGKIKMGNSDDLQIFHNGTNSIIDNNTGVLSIQGDDVRIQNSAGGEAGLRFIADGAVELYHNGVKRLQTQSGGIEVTSGEGETAGIYLTADEGDDNNDYWRMLSATTAKLLIQNYGSGSWETSIECNADGNVELYYDNSKKFETSSSGVNIASGNLQIGGTNVLNSSRTLYNLESIELADDKQVMLGNSGDLRLYHDGSNSYITDVGTGSLLIDGSAVTLRTGSFTVNNAANTENMLYAVEDGGVHLYYNSSKKLETTDWGVSFTGNVSPSANSTHNLGSDAARWATMYGSAVNLNSDIRFASASWTGESCKIQQHSGALYIQGGSSTDYNIILRAGSAGTDRVYMADGGDLYPAGNNTQSLGRSTHQWGTIFAVNYEVNGSIQNVGIGKGVATLRETKGQDVLGGTFTSGADRIRELNVEEHDGESFVTLHTTNHYFTLPAGTYFVYFTANSFDTNSHRAKLITYAGTTVIFGQNARSGSGDSTSTHSMGWGYISPASSTSYYLAHRCQTSRTDRGFGYDMNISGEDEVYAQVTIFRIS